MTQKSATAPSPAARREDEERLCTAFYAAFDRSRCEHLLALSDQDLDSRARLIGEGAHFQAWLLKGPAGGPTMELVLKRATAGLGPKDGVATRAWVKAMRKLQGAGGLVPPFEVLAGTDAVGIVMPFGPEPLGQAAPHWLPIADRLAEMSTTLASRGLVLLDVPQGRSWRGIPFVFDLSDVQERQSE